MNELNIQSQRRSRHLKHSGAYLKLGRIAILQHIPPLLIIAVRNETAIMISHDIFINPTHLTFVYFMHAPYICEWKYRNSQIPDAFVNMADLVNYFSKGKNS